MHTKIRTVSKLEFKHLSIETRSKLSTRKQNYSRQFELIDDPD